jgi:hypothetical protein
MSPSVHKSSLHLIGRCLWLVCVSYSLLGLIISRFSLTTLYRYTKLLLILWLLGLHHHRSRSYKPTACNQPISLYIQVQVPAHLLSLYPIPPPSSNPMVTRAKNNITKPKQHTDGTSWKIKRLLIYTSVCEQCATKYYMRKLNETNILLTKWKLN